MSRMSLDHQEAAVRKVRSELIKYKAVRLADGADSRTIAAALGFTVSTLYKRIEEPQTLTLVEVLRIANVLNVSVSTLVGV